MKRSILESYLGKRVEVKLFDGSVCKGYLHKTGEEQFKRDPNLYWQRNLYFVTADKESMFSDSCLFRTSHVKSIGERRTKMTKYGKLTEKEIKKQFDMMVESAKKEVDKGKNGEDYAFAIGNEALEMLRGNIEYFDYINLEAKKHIKEIIEYEQRKINI